MSDQILTYVLQGIAVLITFLAYVNLYKKDIFSDVSFYTALVLNFFFPPLTFYILTYWFFVKIGYERPHNNPAFWISITILASVSSYFFLPLFASYTYLGYNFMI